MFKNIREVGNKELDGGTRYFSFRKSPVQVTSASVWFDLSMSPGNPIPNYYAASPLIANTLSQSGNGGVFHGASVSPNTKNLRMISLVATAGASMTMMLLDYLLYYPFVDEGTTDEQFMTNNTTIPRYTTGDGVQVMAVSVAGRIGGQQFFINYTNSNGVSGRISQTVTQNSVSVTGSIVSSGTGTVADSLLFIPLMDNDTGVRSIESVTMLGADIGLFTLVLVKPIAQICATSITSISEIDYLLNSGVSLPEIKDDAYLNFVCLPSGSLSGATLIGDIKVTWS